MGLSISGDLPIVLISVSAIHEMDGRTDYKGT